MAEVIKIRAGDTEPVDITVGATGLTDLTGVSAATFYARKSGESTNHVDGAALTIPDTGALDVRFDPAGAKSGGGDAFDAAGDYLCYVLLAMSDGDETRHPGDSDLKVRVRENYE